MTSIRFRECVAAVTRKLIDDIELSCDLRSAGASPTASQRRIDNVQILMSSLERQFERVRGCLQGIEVRAFFGSFVAGE
ncbi:MAG: hypothetical protein MJE77_06200 [Proteobacteria bacterium]|nr:hypothetical protein [Pseudomonadota bacterium]